MGAGAQSAKLSIPTGPGVVVLVDVVNFRETIYIHIQSMYIYIMKYYDIIYHSKKMKRHG
jgi:hypothetical protein